MISPRLQEDPAEGSREIVDRELARQTPGKSRPRSETNPKADLEDLERLLVEIDDARIADILALQPTLAELEEAILWWTGDGDMLDKEGRPLTGKAAEIFDVLTADEDHEEAYGG
jgi:hypothetical protein